jgi:FkbM family methyltransferase
MRRMLADFRAILLGRYVTKSYSQEGEDVILRRIFENQRSGFYVDVGAHHPMRFSNTHLFYRQGWKGINIEPDPEAIRAFRMYRPRDTTVCTGIHVESGLRTYFQFDESALNTFDEEVAASRAARGHRIVRKSDVPVAPLREVLSRHLPAGQEIDFLTVDTEGLDLIVAKSNDWRKFRPRVIVIESLGATVENLLQREIHLFLSGEGYALFGKTLNTALYMRAPADAPVPQAP